MDRQVVAIRILEFGCDQKLALKKKSINKDYDLPLGWDKRTNKSCVEVCIFKKNARMFIDLSCRLLRDENSHVVVKFNKQNEKKSPKSETGKMRGIEIGNVRVKQNQNSWHSNC